jgi:hypothetical protein
MELSTHMNGPWLRVIRLAMEFNLISFQMIQYVCMMVIYAVFLGKLKLLEIL